MKTCHLRNGHTKSCGCQNGLGGPRSALGLTYMDGTCVEMIRTRTVRSRTHLRQQAGVFAELGFKILDHVWISPFWGQAAAFCLFAAQPRPHGQFAGNFLPDSHRYGNYTISNPKTQFHLHFFLRRVIIVYQFNGVKEKSPC